MNGTDDGRGRVAFSENFRARSASRMVRTDRWKYCYFHGDREQLFDMLNDPAEVSNLIAEPQYEALVGALRARAMADWPVEEKLQHLKARNRRMREAEGDGPVDPDA